MNKEYGLVAKALAWSVHFFTASGIFFGFLAILAIHNGNLRGSILWLMVCFFVDAADGTLARLWKVKKVLPNFDGSSIDYVIDFCTYAVIPAFFIYESNLLPDDTTIKLIAIGFLLMASSYYYGKSSYVTDDMHFEGFPVVWNIVACFMYFIFDLDPWANFAWIIIFSILHFIPWKYVYPTQNSENRWLNLLMTLVGMITAGVAVYIFPEENKWLSYIGFIVIAYFGFMTLYLTFRKKTI